MSEKLRAHDEIRGHADHSCSSSSSPADVAQQPTILENLNPLKPTSTKPEREEDRCHLGIGTEQACVCFHLSASLLPSQ